MEPRIAHIVPTNSLYRISGNIYHMCLAQELIRSAHPREAEHRYFDFYKRMVSEGKYVISDNGACEGEVPDEEQLIDIWERLRPTEIVLPDDLSVSSTVSAIKTISFYEKWKSKLRYYRILAVPQGKTFDEWTAAFEILERNIPFDTIGIPKHLVTDTKDSSMRLQIVKWLASRTPKEIHLLGCPINPYELAACNGANDRVRGMDTCYGYISCRQANHPLRKGRHINFQFGEDFEQLPNYLKHTESLGGIRNNGTE